ncbi:MAG: hypothetical protein Q8M08_13350 [Bacteroidales bacterium]|nr:hypothetical protein [Bacteroidales bacterium]
MDKYFGILKNLDINSKKKLIIKLTESIQTKTKVTYSIDELYGVWQDSRKADDIIDYIESSRVNKEEIETL